MKTISIFIVGFILTLSKICFADGIPGVQAETRVLGATQIAQKFCAEDHSDVKGACSAWLEKIEGSLNQTLVLKTVCVPVTDVFIGVCSRSGSFAGVVEFVK